MSDAPCRVVEWDTDFWEVRVAQVVGDRLTDELRGEVDSWCRDHNIACAYFLADEGDPETTRAAERGGFFFTDVRVTLAQRLSESPGVATPPSIRATQPADRDQLAAIARESHRITRFYHDPNFPDERCGELYARWILASCDDPSHEVLVADTDGQACGYVTCEVDGEVGKLGLVAVAEGSRRNGVGATLVDAALGHFAAAGVPESVVVTQGRNVAALRVFTRAGYAVERTQLWFHKWYER